MSGGSFKRKVVLDLPEGFLSFFVFLAVCFINRIISEHQRNSLAVDFVEVNASILSAVIILSTAWSITFLGNLKEGRSKGSARFCWSLLYYRNWLEWKILVYKFSLGWQGGGGLVLSPHSKNILGSNLLDNWGLSVWRLHVPPVPMWVFYGCSLFPSAQKHANTVRLTSLCKLPFGVSVDGCLPLY